MSLLSILACDRCHCLAWVRETDSKTTEAAAQNGWIIVPTDPSKNLQGKAALDICAPCAKQIPPQPPAAPARLRGARRIELPSPEEPWRQPPAAEPAVDWPQGNPYAQGPAVLAGEPLTIQAPIPAFIFQPTQKPHADGDTPRCRTGWCGIQGHRGGA